MYENNIVRVKTEHSSEIRVLFDVLKEVLNEVNITFISKEDKEDKKVKTTENENAVTTDNNVTKSKGYIKIVAVDDHHTVIIYVKLEGNQFSEYFVKYREVNVGLDLRELHKFMKTVDKDCIMTMSIDTNDQQRIEFHLKNSVKSIDKYYRQKLLDTNDSHKLPKNADFELLVYMETADFKKVCTEMNQFAEHIEIICTTKEIIFKCAGDQSELTMKFKNTDKSGVTILSADTEKKNQIFQGIYSLKHLVTFGRCINLCDQMKLYLKNSKAMFIYYTVGSLGEMHVGFLPINEKMIK